MITRSMSITEAWWYANLVEERVKLELNTRQTHHLDPRYSA